MSLLPQEPTLALDPTMRAQEQVAEGATLLQRPTEGAPGVQPEPCSPPSASDTPPRAFPHTLSGGMAQRVAFAAATIGGAPVLIADEPSKGLDRARPRPSWQNFSSCHLDGGGILLTITHDLDLARELGGDVLVMKDAHVVEQGPARQVLTDPAHPTPAGCWQPNRRTGTTPGRAPGHHRAEAGDRSSPEKGLPKPSAGQQLFSDLSVTIRRRGTDLAQRSQRQRQNDPGQRTAAPAATGHRPRPPRRRAPRRPAAKALPGPRPGLRGARRRSGTPSATLSAVTGWNRPASRNSWPPSASPRRCSTAGPGRSPAGNCSASPSSGPCCSNPPWSSPTNPPHAWTSSPRRKPSACLMDQVDRHGCALVLVTHDQALADAVTRRRIPLGIMEHADVVM